MGLNVVLLGAPGAGKGTVSKPLSRDHGLVTISTGDLVRAEVKAQSPVGLKMRAITKRGHLIPDSIMVPLLEAKFQAVIARGDVNGIIFDGFPRKVVQARKLNAMLARYGQSLSGVINVEASEATVVKRLSARRVCPHCKATYNLITQKPKKKGVCDNHDVALEQRPDDKPGAIRTRLRIFKKEEAPLLAHYKTAGLLYRYDGNVGIKASAIAAGKLVSIISQRGVAAQRLVAARRTQGRKPARTLRVRQRVGRRR